MKPAILQVFKNLNHFFDIYSVLNDRNMCTLSVSIFESFNEVTLYSTGTELNTTEILLDVNYTVSSLSYHFNNKRSVGHMKQIYK